MLARSMARRTSAVQRLLVYNADDIAREGIRLYRVVRSDNTEDLALENRAAPLPHRCVIKESRRP
jgi:hypothetical protein